MSIHCNSCIHEKICKLSCDDFCPNCKPITNYDRLISKTPEEIADFMKDVDCPYIFGYTGECYGVGGCRQCWINWLNMEATQ